MHLSFESTHLPLLSLFFYLFQNKGVSKTILLGEIDCGRCKLSGRVVWTLKCQGSDQSPPTPPIFNWSPIWNIKKTRHVSQIDIIDSPEVAHAPSASRRSATRSHGVAFIFSVPRRKLEFGWSSPKFFYLSWGWVEESVQSDRGEFQRLERSPFSDQRHITLAFRRRTSKSGEVHDTEPRTWITAHNVTESPLIKVIRP